MKKVFKQPFFVIGMSLFAVGLGTANPGFWIPGSVFIIIAWSQGAKA